jgi:hypothetical protein
MWRFKPEWSETSQTTASGQRLRGRVLPIGSFSIITRLLEFGAVQAEV